MRLQGRLARVSVFSLGKASLEGFLEILVSNLSKGTDNSEVLTSEA